MVWKTFGLFEPRIDGDESLMQLASCRFADVGMGAEVHAMTEDDLRWVLRFRPRQDSPVVLHLPRHFNLPDPQAHEQILRFADGFSSSIYGMVLHDSLDLLDHSDEYLQSAKRMDAELRKHQPGPRLFVEYAVGLEPEKFKTFFSAIADLERVSACIDIGHVSMRAAAVHFAAKHRGRDLRELKSQGPELPGLMSDVEEAVGAGRRAVIDLVSAVGALNKPMHFHLHDGHPLSTFSRFGVADHLSFFTDIPLNFTYKGRNAMGTAFGPKGLGEVIATALGAGAGELSFTLEIHPTEEQLPLGDAAPLFNRWRDKTNAEKMNHWLAVLVKNHTLLQQCLEAASRGRARN